MAEGAAYGLRRPLDIQQLQFEAQHRWLRPAEICEILRNYQMFQITSEPHNRPPSGSLFLFDRKILRYFRKDGHNWRKKKDGKTVKEAHEKLKVGSVDVLHCYYAHGEDNEHFQRRSYWMLEPDMMHIVFVHYLEVKGNKNIVVNTEGDEVPLDSQKVTSLSTDSISASSSLMSLREDADSEDVYQASSGLRPLHESQHMGNGPLPEKIDAGLNSSYHTSPFSGDHGQSSISGTDYIPVVHGDKFRGNDTPYFDGEKTHGMAPWDTVLQSTAKLHNDPSLASFPSIPPSSMGNVLEQEHTIYGDLLTGKRDLTEEEESSRSLQPSWQIPFEDNSGDMPMSSQNQPFGLHYGSDYGTSLLGYGARNASSEIAPILYSFNGDPKEQLLQKNYPQEHADGQSQHTLKSNSANKVPDEESINYGLTVKRTLLDRDESLKKVDSFSRWVTKELGEVADLNMQSTPGISWSTDECQHVIDDSSLSPSLSQDQLFSINDFSPKWAYAELDIEVLIIGSFLKSQPEVTTCNWSCMFGEVEVPAEVLADGILCCQAPRHKVGRVPFYVTCSNRLACSEVREFDFREGFARNVDFAEFFGSSTEMRIHLRLEKFLTLKPVNPSNHSFEGDMEKRNIIFKLISLREEEEYSIKDEPTKELDISQHTVREHLVHRQVKEKLYSWLLHKVTENGKGPNVLDEDGQGVLHLAAFLGYDWAINPIIAAGVNINFRDVNGWTALHWAAFCGRERTVAFLVSMRADCGAVTDPSPAFPSGRPAADLASANGHKGISGFLAECSLTQNLESLKVDDQKGSRQEISGMKVVQTVLERTATPMLYGDMPDALSMKDSLTAVRNATQAADRIHQVFRMQSFQRKLLTQYEDDDELGLSDQQALSLLASRACKSGQGHGLANAAAIHIQKKFRGWKKRKEFLMIRQRVVKIQAHVRGHQVRKQYKPIIWSVGILEKVILRWRRKGSGLRGFRPDALNKVPSQQNDSQKEDDYDFLKEGRKQKEEKIQKALSRVKSMVQYPEARAQYRRLLNVVEDFRQTKGTNEGLTSSEGTFDGVEDLIDIDMLLDDDNFIPIAFN
ncbi:Calmodulin-binding transcription activator [Vigna angularis]|uniref:Calmodulin-binding transcription activator n=1 Tax=Phaseolus angularis TaxID=3914 RepID=A0A8T0K9I1_PHAAN|nr:calmodulin-binding transcription activator 2 [Vigna angularis]KAG2396256.1 Calmodulin-binding transcription activator [Vigna angularis]